MSHPKTTTTIAAVTLSLWAGFACAEMMQVTGLPDGDSLNVRKGPNASSADIGDLHEGEVIDVLGSNLRERGRKSGIVVKRRGWRRAIWPISHTVAAMIYP